VNLAAHYTRFRVAERLLLTGHSHQAWPDVALDGQVAAFEDAAAGVDEKWGRAFAVADRVRDGFRAALGDPGAVLALGQNTHELVLRFLSAIRLGERPRLVTTDGEFHTLRRQLARLAEEGVELVRVPAAPVDTLADRLAAQLTDRTAAVLVSAVLFETSRIVPGLDELARAAAPLGVQVLVDAYHALGVVPISVPDYAWAVGGGYKYLQLGEGNCFLRIPEHAAEVRPVITGWYAEFAELSAEHDFQVGYPAGSARFAGATYDPTSNYRAARVFDFFAEHGLTVPVLRDISLRQNGLLADLFDALDAPEELITRDRTAPRTEFGGFLSLRSPHAARFQRDLAERGVATDSRGEYLRLGPAPYLSDQQISDSMAILGELIVR